MTTPRPLAPLALALLLASALSGCAGAGDEATRLVVRFAAEPSARDVDAKVPFDASSRPLAERYRADGIPHPDGYTAHDQLEDWSRATGGAYEAVAFNSSFGAGYFLASLGGQAADGSTAYWALSVNGRESAVGMSEAVLAAGDEVRWTYTTVAAAARDPDPIGVTVDPPAPTQGETAVVTGSVDQAATVSIDGGPAIDVPAGRWQIASPPLPYGHTVATLRVEDGVHSVAVPVTFVRLAQGTLVATFTAYPLHEPLRDEVWYDPGVLASAAMYEGRATPRAEGFSVHDFLAAWSAQTGVEVRYTYSEAFGFGVSHVDGVGQPLDSSAPPYWCYEVNGETADLGISLQPMRPGDVVAWDYGACA